MSKPLGQGINGLSQSVDIRVDNFLWSKYFTAAAKSIIYLTREPLLVLLSVLFAIPKVFDRLFNFLSLSVFGQQVLY